MREIKFRGQLVRNDDKVQLSDGFTFFDIEEQTSEQFQLEVGNFVWVKTLMQYTGLKDKNGREIYEGDIVRVYQHAGEFVSQIIWYSYDAKFLMLPVDDNWEIPFDDFAWTRREKAPDTLDEFTILGNIYENPELLHPSDSSNHLKSETDQY